ncbi:MAG: GYD domain-containing protein [Alphaproteobacteria bacterium]|nr:GYD domain-containing protein [Alphaproteobacteria bacterium]
MPMYISLMNYTDQGLRTIKKSTNRADSARSMAEELGGSIEQIYLTMGNYDLIAIADFPDDATAATFVLRIGALGNVKATTLKAFQEDAFRIIIDAV